MKNANKAYIYDKDRAACRRTIARSTMAESSSRLSALPGRVGLRDYSWSSPLRELFHFTQIQRYEDQRFEKLLKQVNFVSFLRTNLLIKDTCDLNLYEILQLAKKTR